MNFPFFPQPAARTRPIGIGGTDIGAILGLSPYKTPLELWSELVCGEPAPKRDLLNALEVLHSRSLLAVTTPSTTAGVSGVS